MALEATNNDELKLPKLPVPNVERTLSRYLDAIRAFIPEQEFEKSEKIVQNFLKNKDDVEAIEAKLRQRSEEVENWAYEWWLNDMYLNNMIPLPVVSNPAWVFPRRKFETGTEMFNYLAKIVEGIGTFKQDIENQKLKFEESGKLCMKQYDRLLTSYRIPGLGRDELKTWDGKVAKDEEHILVLANRYIYRMFLKKGGKWLKAKQLADILSEIDRDSNSRPINPIEDCVSLLTSDSRTNWANARNILLKNDVNRQSLTAIEACLFVVCLDRMSHNVSDPDRSQKELFRQVLTAGGAKVNAANRWFDKTIQIIVSEDGVSGMNYEHTTSEGVAVVTMVLAILKNLDKKDLETNEEKIQIDSSKYFSRLEWNLLEEVKSAITTAALNIDRLDEDTDIEVFRFKIFGKNFMKSCNCSPDSFVQMAMQLTYFRLHDGLCATYESASLRRFRQGRVDSIRASHTSALAWVRTMDDGKIEKSEKLRLFMEAIKTQTRIMKENIFGEGLDIPFLGIRMTCQELWPEKRLEIFEDKSFKVANHFKLSTSQVPIGLEDSYMGYGAVVPDGYGVSYNLQNDGIIFCIASFYSCNDTSSIRFAHTLQQSLIDVKALFNGKSEE